MKYIKNTDGSWGMSEYFSYIESIKNKAPAKLYQFASSRENYSLFDHQSLHDAWLMDFHVTEVATGDRSEIRRTLVNLVFLGPFHDLKICLTYSGVILYKVEGKNSSDGHGDLLMHEVSMESDEGFSHELVFATGAWMKICFTEFDWKIERV